MKTRLLLSAFLLCSASLSFAQTTEVTRSNFTAAVGSEIQLQGLDATQTFTPPSSGQGQTWNFSQLQDKGAPATTTLASAPSNPNFPTATFTEVGSINFGTNSLPIVLYSTLTNQGYYRLGYAVDATTIPIDQNGNKIDIPAQAVVFTTPDPVVVFPTKVGAPTTTTISGATLNFNLTYAPFFTNTPGSYSTFDTTKSTPIADGTLTLPALIAVVNAVAVKNDYVRYDTIRLNGQLAPELLLSQFNLKNGLAATRTSYIFVAPNNPEPVLSWSVEGGAVTSAYYLRNAVSTSTSGVRFEAANSGVSIYPNPALNNLTFSFEKQDAAPWQVEVYNTLGQVIYKDLVTGSGKIAKKLDLSNQTSGMLMYEIRKNNGEIAYRGTFFKAAR